MGVSDDLLNDIKNSLGATVNPSLTAASAVSDLFEAYTLSLVIEAAKTEGATISYRDPDDAPATRFVFRTSPGFIWSTTRRYTFAVIDFPGCDELEAHVGVRVEGKSGVLHEFDVSVIERAECIASRNSQLHPKHAKMLFGIECKFYTTALNLGLARSFVGLGADVTADRTYFVTNNSSSSLEKLLSARKRKWGNHVFPGSTVDVDRVRSDFQTFFKYFKAR